MRNLALALLASTLLSSAAFAAVDNACWNRNIQTMDFWEAPPEGGDSAFFSSTAPRGTIALLFSVRNTMNYFPSSLYEIRNPPAPGDPTPTGCSNNFFNNLQYFMGPADAPTLANKTYSDSTSYPDPEIAYTSGGYGVSDQINNANFYQFGQWPNGSSDATHPGTNSAATACENALGIFTADFTNANFQACYTCLTGITGGRLSGPPSTAPRGYWLNPTVLGNDSSASAGVFKGNFLQFYPPKWVLLKLAYKRLLLSSLLKDIRSGIVSFYGGQGAQVVQGFIPSCNGKGGAGAPGNLKKRVGAVDGLANTGTANPLAESLFNVGWYLGGSVSSWAPSGYFTTNAVLPTGPGYSPGANPNSSSYSGPCANTPCGQSFTIVFSDGRGDEGNPYCTASTASTTSEKPCRLPNQCDTLGMASEDDGNDFLDPSISGGAGGVGGSTNVTGAGAHVKPSGGCNQDYLQDVASFISTKAMQPGFNGNSRVVTYAVGIGSNAYGALASLDSAMKAGGGKMVLATNFQTLESQVRYVLQQIIKRTTSFSVAAITTVQTRGSTFAFIPRFKPLPGNNWQGKLFRFKLFNEFAAGCTAQDYSKGFQADWLNPNNNTSCNDVYLTDADSASASASPTIPGPNFFKSFIGEDSQGNFVKLDTSTALPWAPLSPTQYAVPVWEASAKLVNRIEQITGAQPVPGGGSPPADRVIFTMYDASSTGTYNTKVSFDTATANLNILTPLLKLGGATGAYCTALGAITLHTYSTENDCAADVINFVRGRDVLYANTLAGKTNTPPTPIYARENVLGDIFHSSPILVTPPAPSFLCDLGVANQCLYSLYGTKTAGGQTAYSTYATNNQYRTQLILVGANDGMLHAFNAGNKKVGDDPETPTVENGPYFDLGTGEEAWAFIPPDMLPKLKLYVYGERHEQFIDGTPMVRDIWVDGSGSTSADNQKQADEFHTVAIVGEREGGRHYFALDVTDPANPSFLWEYPQPGTGDDMAFGQTWNDHAPAPPPIGPIAKFNAAGPLTVAGAAGAGTAVEQYVVAIGGGWDPNLVRGRGIYLLDAWTGAVVFRYTAYDTGASSDARQYLYPVAATPALLDTNSDGLFDTLVVGDTMGQLWTISLLNPGPTDGTGAQQWFGGRAFEMAKSLSLNNRTPFFQMAAAARLSTGDIRVFAGSGDRFQIKDSPLTSCGLDNFEGCIRRGCTIDTNIATYQSGAHYDNEHWAWSSTSATFPTTSAGPTSDNGATPSSACTDKDSATITYTLQCNATAVTYTNNLSCDWGATSPGVDCPNAIGKPPQTQLDDNLISCSSPYVGSGQVCFTPTVTATEQNARFYSIHLFDAARPQATTSAQATSYDSARLTDTNLANASTGGLSTTGGNGYFIDYTGWTEKTASPALLLAGCAIWNSLIPTSQKLTCGSPPPADSANLYQADPITGAIACGTSTQTARYVSRTAIVPPPMPTPVVSVNQKTGQVTYSGISLEPGSQPLQIQVGAGDIIGTVNWLEVPRDVHNCRHSTLADGGVDCPQ